MHHLLLTSVLAFGLALSTDDCPAFISCETSDSQASCPEGTYYRQKVKIHNCCPGCVSALKGENQDCKTHEECQPGLHCSARKKCEGDPSQACEYYKRYDRIWKNHKYWQPLCLPNGSFSPKQCKGEKMAGKCFCVNAEGRRIFGEEKWSASESMTCGCSRMADVLSKEGSEVSLHCDHQGNFEPLQCDQKLCWCANPTTGIPYTAMVPFEMMAALPCHDRDAVGTQYYRQCESVNHIQTLISLLLSNHGTTGIVLVSQHCNFDGSYHRVQPYREKKRCVYMNNSPLTEAIKSDDVNCNCAYDKYLANLHREDFLAECKPNGDYYTRQIFHEQPYCVDEDGFHFSDNPDDCPASYR